MGQCCAKLQTEEQRIQYFYKCCRLNELEVVRKLITDPLVRRHMNQGLDCAICGAGIEVFEFLLAQPDIDINWFDDGKETILHIVVCLDYQIRILERVEIVKKLLAHPNIDVNAKDRFGQTPLMIAVKLFNKGLVACNAASLLLVHPKIDINIEDNAGRTALDYADNEEVRYMILYKMPPVITQDVFIMSVPPNTDDAISYETIEKGMLMVDFHGERGFGRYYTKASYDALQQPKRNMMTRQPIRRSEVIFYIADVSADVSAV